VARVLIIGAGGVGNVVTHKCAQARTVFDEIWLASRTLSKCEEIARYVPRQIHVAQVDADDAAQVIALIEKVRPDIVINVALPYQDLPIMDACVATGVHYLDTANYEPPDVPKFEYKWQWAYQERFQQRGIMGVLGCGFDPGVTNAFCAYAQKHLFDVIRTIDIVDCNAGSHGHPFATNFNPEINIREITQNGKYWENGKWKEIPPMSVSMMFNYPEIGERKSYLLYHEELESLVQNIKGLERIRFWMTFSDEYLTHLRVLQNVGMTRVDPVDYEGHPVVPLKFLKKLLPDPASLAATYQGKTCIGCLFEGEKDGKTVRKFIYNVCDHAACFKEVRAQAISYTTGVPAAVGAMMVVTEQWTGAGVYNIEQLDPDPFLEKVAEYGLPWHVVDV
jgi:saccharopine dehydrogenase (NAD+, L-lysine-forming)